MSWELQVRQKKKEWMKIQEARDKLAKDIKKILELKSKVKSMAQDIPKQQKEIQEKMDLFNESMNNL